MMNDKLENCIVIIDSNTKSQVDSIAYIELSNNAIILNDINEITEVYTDYCVVLFEPIILTGVTLPYIRELKNKYNIRFILIGSDKELVSILESVCEIELCNYKNIDINLIYSVIMKDMVILEYYKDTSEILNNYSCIEEKLPLDVRSYYKILYTNLLDILARYNSLLSINLNLQSENDSYRIILNKLKTGIKELHYYYSGLHNNLKEYQTSLTKSYEKTIKGDYPDRPTILYFKQHQHIPGFDILLNILYFVLSIQYKTSCKIVKLIDSSNALNSRYIPDKYTILQNTYNNKDVLINDFILKRGNYDLMFDLILLNRAKLKYLIIHDMRGTSSLALDNSLITSTVNLVSSEYLEFFNKDSVLTDVREIAEMFWNSMEYMRIPVQERLLKLSAHPTIINLLSKISSFT